MTPALPPEIDRALHTLEHAVSALDAATFTRVPPLTFEQLAQVLARLDRSGAHRAGISQQVAAVVDKAKVTTRAAWTGGRSRESSVEGVGTLARSGDGTTTVWEGERLARTIAARVAEEVAYDRETGEVAPPAVIGAAVGEALIEVAGLGNKSQTFRVQVIESMGLDPDEYRDRTPGRSSVRWAD